MDHFMHFYMAAIFVLAAILDLKKMPPYFFKISMVPSYRIN